MTTKKTNKKQNKKQYTLSEFKAWLEGIEELQPDGWSPDATQWATIRDRLLNIVEEVVEVQVPVPTAQQSPVQFNNTTHDRPVVPQQPFQQPPPTFQQSSLSSINAEPEMTPAARAVLSGKMPTGGSAVPPALALGPNGRLKTPNIDTSDGQYTPTFE